MKRNKIVYFMASALLILCGGLFSACGGNDIQAVSTKDFAQTIEAIKNDTSLFETGEVQGLSTEFVLTALKDTNYEFYTECLDISLEYIDRNKQDIAKLEDIKLNAKSQKLKTELEKKTGLLMNKLQVLSSYNDKLSTFEAGAAYDGIFTKFLSICRETIESSYDVALCMAQLEDTTFGYISAKQITKDVLTTNDTNNLKDYLLLYIGKDCSDLLITHSAGLEYADIKAVPVMVNAIDLLASTTKQFGSDCTKTLTGAQNSEKLYENLAVTKLLQINEKQNVERENLPKVFKNFSFYEFVNNQNDSSDSAHQLNYLECYYTLLNNMNQTIYDTLF